MTYGKSTQGSVVSCNVSWKYDINEETLIGILSGKMSLNKEWKPHIETFFNELMRVQKALRFMPRILSE
jgi:hypothetical protein